MPIIEIEELLKKNQYLKKIIIDSDKEQFFLFARTAEIAEQMKTKFEQGIQCEADDGKVTISKEPNSNIILLKGSLITALEMLVLHDIITTNGGGDYDKIAGVIQNINKEKGKEKGEEKEKSASFSP